MFPPLRFLSQVQLFPDSSLVVKYFLLFYSTKEIMYNLYSIPHFFFSCNMIAAFQLNLAILPPSWAQHDAAHVLAMSSPLIHFHIHIFIFYSLAEFVPCISFVF